MDGLADGIANQALLLLRWDCGGVEGEPLCDAALWVGQACDVMGEYLGDPDRCITWLELAASSMYIVVPSCELGETDGSH